MDVYHKEYCALIINAACCLHNICIRKDDDFDAVEPYCSESEYDGNEANTASGNEEREALCHQLYVGVQ